MLRQNNARTVFQNRLPLPLREKKPGEPAPEKPIPKPAEEEVKKEDSKEQSSLHKKEEMSYDVGSEGERSDDEHHKKIDQKKLEKELNQVIYITITETPTNILFYCPSTKYLNLKNEEVIEQEKIKDKYYKDYLVKLKNKESFARKGAQTISKFKSSDVVSTSFNKDTEGTMVDKKLTV